MAAVRPLGAHKPAALEFLIAEQLLPPNPSPDLYRWTLYDDGTSHHGEEEIIATDACVVWSQGSVVRRLFRFNDETQRVKDAVLTWFETEDLAEQSYAAPGVFSGELRGSVSLARSFSNVASSKAKARASDLVERQSTEETTLAKTIRLRALVVILCDRAHVYTFHGASHVVSLPFEVEKTFPTPKGLILQRRPPKRDPIPPTPVLPPAPQNSFWSSQVPGWSPHASQSQMQEQNRASRSARRDIFGTSDARLHPQPKDLPRLYALTDPVSQLNLVVEASGSSMNTVSLHELEPPHESEELLYISSTDELSRRPYANDALLLAVTVNHTTRAYTVWHVCYTIGSSKQPHKRGSRKSMTGVARAKRRSSLNSRFSTGAATPVHRANDGVRESTNYAQSHTPFDNPLPKRDQASESFYLVDDDDNTDAFVSQEPLDFPGRSMSTKGNRRTSSRLARAELSSQDQHQFLDMARNPQATNTSFGGASRRGYSFGGNNDRSSFGRSRMSGAASTPGSISFLSDVDESMTDVDDAQLLEGWVASGRFDMGSSLLDNPRSLKRGVIFVKAFSIPFMSGGEDRGLSVPQPDAGTNVTILLRPDETISSSFKQRRCASILLGFPARQQCYEVLFTVSVMESKREDHLRPFAFPERTYRVKVRDGVLDIARSVRHGVPTAIFLKRSPKDQEASLSIASPASPHDSEGTRSNLRESIATLCSSTLSSGADDLKQSTTLTADVSLQNKSTESPRLPNMMKFGQVSTWGRFGLIDDTGAMYRFQICALSRHKWVTDLLRALESVRDISTPGQQSVHAIWEMVASGAQNTDDELQVLSITVLSLLFLAYPELQAKTRSSIEVSSLASIGTRPMHASAIIEDLQLQNHWNWGTEELGGSAMTKSSVSRDATSAGQPDYGLQVAVAIAQSISVKVQQGLGNRSDKRPATRSPGERENFAAQLLAILALFYFEQGLGLVADRIGTLSRRTMANLIVQLGRWLRWGPWCGGVGQEYYFDVENTVFDDGLSISPPIPFAGEFVPPSQVDGLYGSSQINSLRAAALPSSDPKSESSAREPNAFWRDLTPKTQDLLSLTFSTANVDTGETVADITRSHTSLAALETLPEGYVANFRDSLKGLQINPPSSMPGALARLAGREDLCLFRDGRATEIHSDHSSLNHPNNRADLQTICRGDEKQEVSYGRLEGQESLLTHIFREDKRWLEAAKLIDPIRVAVAVIQPQGGQTEADFLEAQKAKAQLVYQRTMALPSGQAIMRFGILKPILTEKIKVTTFNTTCNMQPSNNSVNADKSNFTEEKVGWAFFHAGVNAGLQISSNAPGIDTPWLILNKPQDLGNRHAGLLLALGLNGHLKKMAKWLAFKYLTPKHTMTSVGLLLGLAASHIGTMDTLVTRLLSVHVSRLLPMGAAELNLSGLTQTAGIIGVGLLYYSTSHRRMSEVMLSEIEHVDLEEPDAGQDGFRDEGYRLAAGFALGLINLGRGKDLRALHDMNVIERLLQVAKGPREISVVHVLDQATAGAVIAIALIFMKSQDRTIAQQVDIPKRSEQFDAIRPDILLLRTVAHWLILWDEIEPDFEWIKKSVPKECPDNLLERTSLRAADIPYYNILAGMCWALAIKYAGSASPLALKILTHYYTLVKGQLEQPAKAAPTFDECLARDALLRWQHLLALAMATVFAGTGNLDVLRHLRGMHADLDQGKTFGFHLAAHQAVGLLFMGQGRYTLGTSNLAIASMLAAFYPIFPKDVLDNKAHLQALRHMWVFAAENRCLVPRDAESRDIVHTPIKVVMRQPSTDDTPRIMEAPCLLPDLATIERIETASAEYWPVTLDLSQPEHLAAFKRHQTIFLRRKPLTSQHPTVFASTLAQLNERPGGRLGRSMPEEAASWVFGLDAFKDVNVDGVAEEVLAPRRRKDGRRSRDAEGAVARMLDARTTAVDDVMALRADAESGNVTKLTRLKWLLDEADGDERADDGPRWLRREWVEGLRAKIMGRVADMVNDEAAAVTDEDDEQMMVD